MLPSSEALSQSLKWHENEWQQHSIWKQVIKTKPNTFVRRKKC